LPPNTSEISLQDARVLVTGASGFIGSHLVSRLLDEGAIIAAVSRTRGRLAALPSRDFQFIPCDLLDEARIGTVAKEFRPSIVLHYASCPDAPESPEHTKQCIDQNLRVTANVINAVRDHCSLLVFGDSAKVFGNAPVPHSSATPIEPNSAYAITKAAAWWLCQSAARESGFAAVSLRPTLVYGPDQGGNLISYVAHRALEGADEIPLLGGSQTRDPLFIDDAIEAVLAAMRRGRRLSGRSIAISGGEEISVADLARRVIEAAGSSARIVTSEGAARSTEIWRSVCHNHEALRLLDWRPRVSLAQGLDRTAQSIVRQSVRQPLP